MNSFGRLFRIHIYGESHGRSVGVVIDGCPPGIDLSTEDLESDLKRRKPDKSGTTARQESDVPHIKSGVFRGRTTGSPVMIEFYNRDIRSEDYSGFENIPRPGHADFAAGKKYQGFNDHRGGGHFSARLTVALVAAGVIAKKIIKSIKITSRIVEVCGIKDFEDHLDDIIEENDSCGGIIECTATGLDTGIGEPFFDSLESVLSHIIFSIPSVKGIEFGKGFFSSKMKGSEYNDIIKNEKGTTLTNNCGGITGGISNGNNIVFRAAFRPPSSIPKEQSSFDLRTKRSCKLSVQGRHDSCPVLRAPVIVECAAAVAICDLFLIDRIYKKKKS